MSEEDSAREDRVRDFEEHDRDRAQAFVDSRAELAEKIFSQAINSLWLGDSGAALATQLGISRVQSPFARPPIILYRFSDRTPALKCVMTDDLHRRCPHCGGKNTSYFIGVEETVWFTTKYETADGFGLFACSDINRDKCPNLPKPEPAIAQRDNGTGGDAQIP